MPRLPAVIAGALSACSEPSPPSSPDELVVLGQRQEHHRQRPHAPTDLCRERREEPSETSENSGWTFVWRQLLRVGLWCSVAGGLPSSRTNDFATEELGEITTSGLRCVKCLCSNGSVHQTTASHLRYETSSCFCDKLFPFLGLLGGATAVAFVISVSAYRWYRGKRLDNSNDSSTNVTENNRVCFVISNDEDENMSAEICRGDSGLRMSSGMSSDSPVTSNKDRKLWKKSIDSAASVGSLSQDSESSGIGMEKDSWNSSSGASVHGGSIAPDDGPMACNKSFHAGTHCRPSTLASLTSVIATTDGIIRSSFLRLKSTATGGNRDSDAHRHDGLFGAGSRVSAGFYRRGIANSVGGTIGMSTSCSATLGGVHHQHFRRPDWLAAAMMGGSTLTDASSLDFEDNDYQWCSDYASSLHSPGCGSASGSSTCFKPVGLLSLSTSGVVHDSSVPQTPDDPPSRARFDAKAPTAVVDSMYGGEEDVARSMGPAMEFEVFPAEDIQGFMQFPEESGQSGVIGAGGETFASITQSLMAAQEWGSVDSHTRAIFRESSDGVETSICGSTPLFSPTRDYPIMGVIEGDDEDEVSNVSIGVFSVDSLDVNDASSKYQKPDGTVVSAREEYLDDELDDLELTWTTAAIKNNYTLAFEGSYTTTTHEVSSPDESQDGSRASTAGPSWTESIDRASSCKMAHSSTSGILSHKPHYTWSQVKLLKTGEIGSGGTLVDTGVGGDQPSSTTTSETAATGGARSSSMPDLMRRSMMAAGVLAKNPGMISKSTFTSSGTGRKTILYDVSRSPVPKRKTSASLAQLFMRNRRMMASLSMTASKSVTLAEDEKNADGSTSEEEEVSLERKGSNGSTNDEFCSAKSNLSSNRSGARAPDIPTDPSKRNELADSQSTAQNISSDVLPTDRSSSSSSRRNKHSHKSMQTSASVSEATTTAAGVEFSEDSLRPGARQSKQQEKASILVCYPNYALPDLTFLSKSSKKYDANVYLCPQKPSGSPDTSVVDTAKLPKKVQQRRPESAKPTTPTSAAARPLSTDDMLRIQESSFSHIKDWDSLQTLLPDGVKKFITRRKTSIAETGEPSFEPEIKFRKPRPKSCDPALFLRKSFILEESEFEENERQRSEGGARCRVASPGSSGLPQPKGILRKTYSTGEDRSLASNCSSEATPTPSGASTPSSVVVRRRGNNTVSPASRLLRNLRSKSAENQQKQLAAASRRQKHRESYIYDDSNDPSSVDAAGVGVEDDDSSATIGANNTASNSSCGCRTPVGDRDSTVPHGKRPDALELRSHVSEMISARSNLSTPTRQVRKRFHRSAGNLFDGKLTYSEQAEEYYGKSIGSGAKVAHCPCGAVLRHRKSVSFAELDADGDCHEDGAGGEGKDWCWDCGAYAADVPTLWAGSGPALSSASLPTTPLKCARAALSPTLDFSHKQDLVENLASAMLELRRIVRQAITGVGHQRDREDMVVGGALPGASSTEKRISEWAVDSLCPAIYAALSDGLLPQIQTLFGSVPNSLWKVVEISSQLGSTTKALNDLVIKVNSEEHLNEGPLKFNAFICGLLNIQSLRSWLCYLRTRESVIQKHFHPHAFLYGANSWSRMLYDEMLSLLAPLSTQSFNLDLLYEYRRLHSSFQFMEEKMKHHLSADRLDSKCNMLDDGSDSGTRRDDHQGAMRKAHSQDYFLDSGVGTTQSDKPEADQHLRGMVRTRSSMDNTNTVTDFAAGVRKRWSGVQLGSKLLQALDQLALDDDDVSSGTGGSEVPQIRDSDGSDKNGNKRSQESVKFSRLRRKWEILSGNKKSLSPLPSKIPRPIQKISPTSNKTLTSPAACGATAAEPKKKPDPPAKPAVMPKTFPMPFSSARPRSAPQKAVLGGRRQDSDTLQPPVMTPESEQSCFSPMDTSSSSARSSSSAGSGVQSKQQHGRAGAFSRWMSNQLPPKQLVNKSWKPPISIPPKPTSVSETHRANPSGTLGMAASPLRSKPRPGGMDDNANGDNFSDMRRVRTICHHLGKENGHLSFNKDQEMALVVEVDDRWLLCATGDQKGLVPRNSVVFC